MKTSFQKHLAVTAEALRKKHNRYATCVFTECSTGTGYYTVLIGRWVGCGETLAEAIVETERKKCAADAKRLIKLASEAALLGFKLIPVNPEK